MSFEVDITDPDDPLNQRFRVHFSNQDSTFLSFLKALDKPLLKYLKSVLIQHFCAIAITEPAETGASNSRCGILTGDPDTDRARLIPSMTVRQFLIKCIDCPSSFIELDQLQFPVTENAHGLLQQIDWVTEMNMLVSIRLRFTKLAWYRSYRQFAQSRGLALSASFDRFGVLLPRLVTVGFEDFVNNVTPDANESTKISINQVILAGFRYDYMTRHEQTDLYSDDNDAYLFLLPGCISIHQWEHDLLDTELQQVRGYLHRLGLKRIIQNFPSSLHNLAQAILNHYMVLIESSGMKEAVPQNTTIPAAASLDPTKANSIPSSAMAQTPRTCSVASQLRHTNSDATPMSGYRHRPSSPDQACEEATMYAQASRYIAKSNQRRDPTTSKRSQSPAVLPAPAFGVGHQEGQRLHPSEPPSKPPNVLTGHVRTPSTAGQSQQAGVNHHQQPQAWQNAVVKYIPTTQQQIQLGPSAFANHHSTWVGGAAQRGEWPAGRRPSEAALSENQPTGSTFIHASECKFNHRGLDKGILAQMFLAATARSQGENYPHSAGSYLGSKSPPTTNRYTQYQNPHSESPIESQTTGFSHQQQQAISHEASQATSFWERQAASSPETAKTVPLSYNNIERQPPRSAQSTGYVPIAPAIPTRPIAQMLPKCHGMTLPQTPPRQRDIQSNKNVYDRQRYDIISPQEQYQDLGQNQLPSPISAITNPHPPPGSTNHIRPYSIPKSTEQTIARYTATSNTAPQHGNTSMSRIKNENCTKPTSPPSGTMDVDETEVAKKSNIGIKKQRLLTDGGSPQQPVRVDEDGDEDEDDAAEDGQGKESKKRKKLRRCIGRRR